ncbi:MAG: radical SAM protein [Planctomycetota bacterium]|nr:radical SAM protein [Planctomycetota bacterium]
MRTDSKDWTAREFATGGQLINDPAAEPLPRVDPIQALPIVVLFPHSGCNCRCLMCDIWRKRERQEIAPEDVARWLPEWRGLNVQRVVLSGGEPLLHSDLWRLCDPLRQAGMAITVLTTGLLLKRDAESLARYCDDVIVSLDGPRDVHNQIRNVPQAYERLAEGVSAVRRANPGARISGRCTVQRRNFGCLRATVAAAHELGLKWLSFLAADVRTEAFHRPGGWTHDRVASVALEADDLPQLAAELAALERDCAADLASGYIRESPEKLRRCLVEYFRALVGRGGFPPLRCNAPWVSTVIETEGTVRPCFFQPPLGNVFAVGGLAAVLNAPQAIAWRRALDVRRNEICRKCVCTLSWKGEACSVPPAVALGGRGTNP